MKENEKVVDLIIMEYEKLQEYYLWSLSTHSERIDLYLKVLLAAFSACFTIACTAIPDKYLLCGGLAFIFVIFGVFIFERVVSAQTTNIWCIMRLNILRETISEKYGLKDVFKPITMRNLAKKTRLFGLLKYRLVTAKFEVLGNSIMLSVSFFFLLVPFLSYLGLVISITIGIASFLLHLIYFNNRYSYLHALILQSKITFEEDLTWINESLIKVNKP